VNGRVEPDRANQRRRVLRDRQLVDALVPDVRGRKDGAASDLGRGSGGRAPESQDGYTDEGAGNEDAGVVSAAGVLETTASQDDCGSPSQQPSLNRQRGHCHVPCRHSIVVVQRQQRSLSAMS
jgi:hypothetical protein